MIYMIYSDGCHFCHYYRQLIKEYGLEDKFTLINIYTEVKFTDDVIKKDKLTLNVPSFFTMKEGKPKVISSLLLKNFITRHGVKLPEIENYNSK